MKYIILKILLVRDSKSDLWEFYVWLSEIKLLLKREKILYLRKTTFWW